MAFLIDILTYIFGSNSETVWWEIVRKSVDLTWNDPILHVCTVNLILSVAESGP